MTVNQTSSSQASQTDRIQTASKPAQNQTQSQTQTQKVQQPLPQDKVSLNHTHQQTPAATHAKADSEQPARKP